MLSMLDGTVVFFFSAWTIFPSLSCTQSWSVILRVFDFLDHRHLPFLETKTNWFVGDRLYLFLVEVDSCIDSDMLLRFLIWLLNDQVCLSLLLSTVIAPIAWLLVTLDKIWALLLNPSTLWPCICLKNIFVAVRHGIKMLLVHLNRGLSNSIIRHWIEVFLRLCLLNLSLHSHLSYGVIVGGMLGQILDWNRNWRIELLLMSPSSLAYDLHVDTIVF